MSRNQVLLARKRKLSRRRRFQVYQEANGYLYLVRLADRWAWANLRFLRTGGGELHQNHPAGEIRDKVGEVSPGR